MKFDAEKQHLLDVRYLKMATIWAENSYCIRRKVGALIVKNKIPTHTSIRIPTERNNG